MQCYAAINDLPIADFDIMKTSVHPVHEELHTGHVGHKVCQVPAHTHI